MSEENEEQEENVFVQLGEHDDFFDDHLYIQEDAHLCQEEYSKLWQDGFNNDDDYADQDNEALMELEHHEAEHAQYILLEQEIHMHDDAVDHSSEFYEAKDIGMAPLGVEYVRNIPSIYDEESSNKFMHIILTQFALEGKKENGDPNGVFKMNKKETERAGHMIVEKYKKIEDKKKLDEYMKQYFTRTWEHFDVNNDGMLDASDMPAFMKYLCSD